MFVTYWACFVTPLRSNTFRVLWHPEILCTHLTTASIATAMFYHVSKMISTVMWLHCERHNLQQIVRKESTWPNMASWCDLNKCWKRLNSFTALCYLFIFMCDICSISCRLKTPFPPGTVSWDFCYWFILWIVFPPKPLRIASGSFIIFSKTTPAANLPLIELVLLIPVANCHQCHWHRRQISNKVTLKKKIYLYVDSATQRSSKK